MTLEARIALHHTFSSQKSWIALIGVSLGVMSLIVVISAINGFEKELEKQMIGHEAHIILYRKDQGIKDWQKTLENIKTIDSRIQSVLPVTYNEVLWVSSKTGRVSGGVIEGVDARSSSLISGLEGKRFVPNACYVGEELAKKLQVKPGDTIQALIPKTQERPVLVKFNVLGTFSSGLYEYSSRYVYADLSDTQKKMGWGNTISAFKVHVDDPSQAASIARKIRSRLEFPFFIRTWMDINRNIFIALKIEKIVIAIILSAILLVALFNVISSLIMMVLERTREISILKAMGMRKNRMIRIFVMQGIWMGVVGSAIGVGLSVGVCQLLKITQWIRLSPEIYYLSYLPVEMRWNEIGMIVATLIVVSGGAALVPAFMAARQYPVEGLRYE